MGFEPSISAVTGRRALQATPRGQQVAQVGIEPTASPGLSRSGLPVAYRARIISAPGVGIEPTASWFRARRHYQQRLPRNPPSFRPGLASQGSGRRGRTFIAWFKARQPTVSRSPRAPCGNRTHLNGPVPLHDVFAGRRMLCRRHAGSLRALFFVQPRRVQRKAVFPPVPPLLRWHHNLVGGGEVFLHENRRHRQEIADIVEAVAHVIGREVVGRVKVNAEEVTNRVVVLRTVEASQGDSSWVGLGSSKLLQLSVQPRRDRFYLGCRRLPAPRRRHLVSPDIGDDLTPGLHVLSLDRLLVPISIERQTAFGLRATVALGAVMGEKGTTASQKSLYSLRD